MKITKKKTTIYLDENDRKSIETIREFYRVGNDSDAIRLALSLTSKDISKKDKK